MEKNKSLPKLHRFYVIRRTETKLKQPNAHIARNSTLGAPLARSLVVVNSLVQSDLLSRKLLPRLDKGPGELRRNSAVFAQKRKGKASDFMTQCDHMDFPSSPIASLTQDEVESALEDS